MTKKENTFRPLMPAVRTVLVGTGILAFFFFAVKFPSAVYGGWKETEFYYLISFRYCALMVGLFCAIWAVVGWLITRDKSNLGRTLVQFITMALCVAVASVVLHFF